MNKYLKPIGIYVLIFVVILAALAYTGPQILPQRNDAAQEEYVYSDLLKELDENNVASVEVSRRTEVGDYGTAEATLKDGSVIRVDVPSISVLQQVLDEKALTNDVKIDVGDLQRESMLSQVVPSLIMMIVMIIIFILLFNRMQGGGGKMNNFGKSKAKMSVDGESNVTFDNVAGCDEEKGELEELVEFLKAPKKFTELGARIPKGVLLQALLPAVYHLIVLIVFQQHADDGVLRDKRVDAVFQVPERGGFQQVVGEAGAIVVIDRLNPLHHVAWRMDGGEYRQIAALGMAAQPQLDPGVLMGHGLRVCHCHFLSGDLPHTAQIEILFPPCQRIVGTPEGEVDGAIPALCRQRRELLRLHRVQMVHKAVELHVPEPGRGCRPAQQLRNLIGHQNAHVDGPAFRFGKIRLRRPAQQLRRGRRA